MPGVDHIDIWRIDLDQSVQTNGMEHALLSSEERIRAARFRRPCDRVAFVTCRSALRTLIGRSLALPPGSLRFCCGPFGKPSLIPEQYHADLRFNVSHTDGMALIAISQGHEVGVDVERLREDWPLSEMASMLFSRHEYSFWESLPPIQQREWVWKTWVRNEACAKAPPEGQSLRLSAEALSLPDDWTLTDLDVGAGHRAALAFAGRGLPVRLRAWSEVC